MHPAGALLSRWRQPVFAYVKLRRSTSGICEALILTTRWICYAALRAAGIRTHKQVQTVSGRERRTANAIVMGGQLFLGYKSIQRLRCMFCCKLLPAHANTARPIRLPKRTWFPVRGHCAKQAQLLAGQCGPPPSVDTPTCVHDSFHYQT